LQCVEALQPDDIHVQFFQWMISHLRTFNPIIFSDEAKFSWDRMSSSQHSYLWSANNPQSTLKEHFNMDSQ
jgi:hypothetical protein